MGERRRGILRGIAVVLVAAALAVGLLSGCSSGPTVRTITVTFIRHAQSAANADGIIDTEVPGPSLTAEGEQQAQQIANQLVGKGYDGIYASTMVRSQQTAAPLAAKLGRQVQVLPGLREIGAGWYDGKPVSMVDSTYLLAPAGWLRGDRTEAMPGVTVGNPPQPYDGNVFNDEFSAAIQQIYDNGDAKPVVFAHGVSIGYWTLMNVTNPKDSLLTEHPLPNVGRVVITGSPTTGWRLVDWDGIRSFDS